MKPNGRVEGERESIFQFASDVGITLLAAKCRMDWGNEVEFGVGSQLHGLRGMRKAGLAGV